MSENQREEYTEDERRFAHLLRMNPDKAEIIKKILSLTENELDEVMRRIQEEGIVL